MVRVDNTWMIQPFKVVVFIAFFAGVFFALGAKSSALSGAGTYFPDTSPDSQADSYAIVQVTGSKVANAAAKMKARTTIANIYVPKSMQGSNVTVTIINGCHGTVRDNDTAYGNTSFNIFNQNYDNGGGASPRYGRSEAAIRTDSPGVCSGTPNINLTFNASAVSTDGPAYKHGFTIDKGTEYNVYQFTASGEMVETGSARRYLNAFGLASTAPVQVGISGYPGLCAITSYPISCPSPRTYKTGTASFVYSSFYGPQPASLMSHYSQRIKINASCEMAAGISFYDLDASDSGLSQNNMEIRLYKGPNPVGAYSPNGTYTESIPVTGMQFWQSGVAGLLNPHPDNPEGSTLNSGGNNNEYMDIPGFIGAPDPMFAALGNFERDVDYELQINNVDSDNAIQILPSYPGCQNGDGKKTVTTCEIKNITNIMGNPTILPNERIKFDVVTTYSSGTVLGFNGYGPGSWEYTAVFGNEAIYGGSPVGNGQFVRTPVIQHNDPQTTTIGLVSRTSNYAPYDLEIHAPSTAGRFDFNWGLIDPADSNPATAVKAQCTGESGKPPPELIITDQILGCMNPAARNYNPAATVDDGSCIINVAPSGNIELVCQNDGYQLAVRVINAYDGNGDTMTISLDVQHNGGPTNVTGSGGNGTITPTTSTFNNLNYLGDDSTRTVSGTIYDGYITVYLEDAVYDCNRPPCLPSQCPFPPPGSGSDQISADCENYTFNLYDPDGDTVSVSFLVNDSLIAGDPQFNLVNQAANGNSHTFPTESWRDFRQHKFEIRINDNQGSGDKDYGERTVGPCMRMTCGGLSASPPVIEVGSKFTVSANFITKRNYPPNTSDDLIMGSRGTPETYNVNLSFSPALAGAPGAIATNQPINSTLLSAILSHTSNPINAPATATDYTINYILDSTTNDGMDINCPDSGNAVIKVSQLPYIQMFRSDVVAGYGMKDTAGSCTTSVAVVEATTMEKLDSSGGIVGYVGSGTQSAVFAMGAVKGFRSAITETGQNALPWLRTFANTNKTALTPADNINTFGGLFNSSLCAENWFEDEPASGATAATVDINSVSGVVKYTGNTQFVAVAAISGSRKVFVDGNITIGSGGVAESIVNTTTWANIYDIPSTTLVARGNIYIDASVTRLDAVLVATGTVFTCTSGTLPADSDSISSTTNAAAYQVGGACYNNSLTLNGAIISNNIRLWRTGGTISRSVSGESQPYQGYAEGLTQAETFRLSPEIYLSTRLGEASTNGAPGKKHLDSIISLPPPF